MCCRISTRKKVLLLRQEPFALDRYVELSVSSMCTLIYIFIYNRGRRVENLIRMSLRLVFAAKRMFVLFLSTRVVFFLCRARAKRLRAAALNVSRGNERRACRGKYSSASLESEWRRTNYGNKARGRKTQKKKTRSNPNEKMKGSATQFIHTGG